MVAHLTGISPLNMWQGFCAQPSSVTTMITEERVKGEVVFRCMQFGDLLLGLCVGKSLASQVRI